MGEGGYYHLGSTSAIVWRCLPPPRACTSHLQWKSLSARWPPIPGKVADSITGSKLVAKGLPLTPPPPPPQISPTRCQQIAFSLSRFASSRLIVSYRLPWGPHVSINMFIVLFWSPHSRALRALFSKEDRAGGPNSLRIRHSFSVGSLRAQQHLSLVPSWHPGWGRQSVVTEDLCCQERVQGRIKSEA